MADFEHLIEQAVAAEDIPGCVLHAINRDGSFKYAKAFGKRSVRPGGDQSPLNLDTIMWIASCTKLMTSICALQLVERGLVTLDEPVYKHIPELKDFPIITGFKDDGEPIEEPHKNPITLRLLLTHASGLTYQNVHPTVIKWEQYHKKEPNLAGTVLERFTAPMVFEPGTSWIYGCGIDYAGLLIERVAKMSLEDFMRENLWEPLGVTDMTFHLDKRPDLKARMAEMSQRDESTGKVVNTDANQPYQTQSGALVEGCMGGQGVFTSGAEYIKILQGLLSTDENEKILKKETVEMFFTPQLGPESAAMLNIIVADEVMNNILGGAPREIKKDWGLGGLLLTGDSPDGKRENTMIWGGLPNLTWFCDRKAGLTGLYAGQVLPPGDGKVAALAKAFQAGVYRQYHKGHSGTT